MYDFYPFSAQRIVSRFVIKVLIIIILLAGVSGIRTVLAAGGTAHFSIVPGIIPHSNKTHREYFTYTSQPGFLIQDSLHVTNVGTARGSIDLYAVDATTNQASGVTFFTPTDPRHDVGAWITLSNQRITLSPGQSQDVPFSLHIPSSVRPGQHGGGIIARDAIDQTSSSKSGAIHTTIHIQRQEILGVLVNLPGALVQKLNVAGITYNRKSTPQSLLIGLSNIGTQILHPSGNLQVTDKKGRLLQNIPLKLAAILPQTAINYPVPIDPNTLSGGTYIFSVSLEYEGGHSVQYKAHFMVPQSQPSMNQTSPKPATGQASPNPGADHTIISHNVFPNPASFAGLPWRYMGGILIIMMLLVTLFLWRRRPSISYRRFLGRKKDDEQG
jgi:hypothetical protein